MSESRIKCLVCGRRIEVGHDVAFRVDRIQEGNPNLEPIHLNCALGLHPPGWKLESKP